MLRSVNPPYQDSFYSNLKNQVLDLGLHSAHGLEQYIAMDA